MNVIELTKDNFDKEVMESDKTVLIDFWASWCIPCKMLSPIVEQIAEEYEQIKVCKVNVDKEGELAASFNVEALPMLAVIKNKEIAKTSIGLIPKEEVLQLLDIK